MAAGCLPNLVSHIIFFCNILALGVGAGLLEHPLEEDSDRAVHVTCTSSSNHVSVTVKGGGGIDVLTAHVHLPVPVAANPTWLSWAQGTNGLSTCP